MLNRLTRFVPLTSVLFAPLVVVVIVLSPNRPPSTASGHDVISFYMANPSPRLLSAYLGGVVIFLDLFIYGWLRDCLRLHHRPRGLDPGRGPAGFPSSGSFRRGRLPLNSQSAGWTMRVPNGRITVR
jgi:hypothetical protein